MRAPFREHASGTKQKKRQLRRHSLRPFAITAASSLSLNHRSVSSVGRAVRAVLMLAVIIHSDSTEWNGKKMFTK
jgi:hypothetical protein